MPGADLFARLGLFAVSDFLEPDLRERVRSSVASATAVPATVRQEGDVYGVDEDTRRTKQVSVPDETAALVRQRLLAVKPEVEKHYGVQLTALQPLQFLVYSKGDFFRRHVDRGPEAKDATFSKQRRVSAILFLNGESQEPAADSYGGGALTIYGLLDDKRAGELGLPLTGEPGLLITFPSEMVHEVTPVTHGQRYTVATWFT
jgi:SM-20-related protein